MCLGSHTILLAGSLYQLLDQTFTGPSQLCHLSLRGGQLFSNT
jgi:hypothetical protein